jgi:hypothetical protein
MDKLAICGADVEKLVKTRRIKGKYLLIVFFLFTTTFAYSQTELKMLEKAYKNNSKEELKNFFDNWSREITLVTDDELLTYNDTIREAYKVFVDFLIIQNALYIYFEDSMLTRNWYERNGKLTDSIINFRPKVQCNGKIPLYLSKKYKEGMDVFHLISTWIE